MSEQFQLDSDGTCKSCNLLSPESENIECFMCKFLFHVLCPESNEEEKVASKSLVSCFNRPTTKQNFQFFCNPCMTKLEVSMAERDEIRLNKLETNMDNINADLTEIKNLLCKQLAKPAIAELKPSNEVNRKENGGGIWFNKEKLASVKAPPSKSLLVVNKITDADDDESSYGIVEKAVIDNLIPVTKSFKNDSGDLVIICESIDSRDKLKEMISSKNENIKMKAVPSKRSSITIVGLREGYKKEEILNQLVSQNQFLKLFSMANDIGEHLELFDVKPTRSNPSVYQAFGSVSEVLRQGFKNYGDKVVIGLMRCKIYDRNFIKRCNNCQGYGHFYKECPTPDVHCCAKCSEGHPTSACPETSPLRCTNCTKAGTFGSDHATYDHKCPSRIYHLEEKKNRNEKRLNWGTT